MAVEFGARLRMERERKGIGLDAIAQSTKINVGLLEALERGDTSRWPSGLFRRAFIRAYASAIGVDPESTVREFLQHFPDPADEPQAARERVSRGRLLSQPHTDLRMTLVDERRVLSSACVEALMPIGGRAAAAVCDLVVVIALALVVFTVAGEFWTPFALAAASYYVGGMLTFGNSLGAWLVARRRTRPASRQDVTSTPPTPASALAGAADHIRSVGTSPHPTAAM